MLRSIVFTFLRFYILYKTSCLTSEKHAHLINTQLVLNTIEAYLFVACYFFLIMVFASLCGGKERHTVAHSNVSTDYSMKPQLQVMILNPTSNTSSGESSTPIHARIYRYSLAISTLP
jgi:hypothetical protein